ncbi:MAG: XRE family transcriptional regulator, partial [Pseudomonadota bacterium]
MKMSRDENFTSSLGADLRSIRKSRGLTLTDLADRIGRSVGWVSQVERDISQPSIDDLRELASALSVPLSIFFGSTSKAEEVGKVVRANLRRTIGGGEMGLKEELLSPDLTDDFEMVRSVFEAGAELKQPVSRPTQEVGYLVSGRLSLWIGDQRFDLEQGDSF